MLKVNELPKQNMDISATNCCPRFNPEDWDSQTIVLDNKSFVRASTMSFMYMPLNMGSMMRRTQKAIDDAGARVSDSFLMLSQDVSPWKAYHYLLTSKDVPGQDNVKMSGKFLAKVFEGEFKQAGQWYKQILELGKTKNPGATMADVYFYYTTCPKCAKIYGKNYVVGLVKVG